MKNTGLLVVGTLTSQTAAAIAVPLLSRLYAPEAFGLFTLFFSISGIMSVLVSLRYEFAIALPRDEPDAANILVIVFLAVLGSTCIITAVLALASSSLQFATLRGVLWAFPFSLLAVGLWGGLNYWSLRRGHFSTLAAAQAGSSATPLMQVLLGLLGLAGAGLIVGQLIGQWTTTLITARKVRRQDLGLIRQALSKGKVIKLAVRYLQFPLYSAPQAALSAISQNAPILLFSSLFGMQVVGYYGFAIRILQMPINLLSQSYQQVFLRRISEARRMYDDVLNPLKEATLRLALIGVFPAAILMTLGGPLFASIFGEAWTEAGYYTQWLALFILGAFVASPSYMTMITFERLQFLFWMDVAQLVLRIVGILVGSAHNSAHLSVALFSITGFTFNVIVMLRAIQVAVSSSTSSK